MSNQSESVSLAFNDLEQGGTSDKVYHLSLEKQGGGYTVTAQYGRRGSALTTDSKTKNGPIAYEYAKQSFDRVLREKLGKGYVVEGTLERREAPIVVVPERVDTPKGGTAPKRQELLEEITTEEGLRHFLASEDYWMQDKTDGHSRGVVKTLDGAIYGLNKKGVCVPLDAKLVAELAQIPLIAFQLDAELVGDRLVCRDLLVAGRDIAQLPYEERFLALVAALLNVPLKLVSVVPTWQGTKNKIAALARQRKERREGVVFKLKRAPHRIGRNGQHKKYKFVKTVSVIAGKPRAKGKDSVEIFLRDGKGYTLRVGTVSLIGKQQIREGDILEVRYLYAFPSKMLCQARFMRVRMDVHATECTTAQLVYKRD